MPSGPIGMREVENEEVRLAVDCWRYNFGLKTLGGGYVRHVLAFAERHIVDLETSHVENTPPPWHGGLARWAASTASGGPLDWLASLVFWGAVEWGVRGLLGSPEDELSREYEAISSSLQARPTVGRFTEIVREVLRKSGVRRVEVSWVYGYGDLLSLGRRGSRLTLEFRRGRKRRRYEVVHGDQDALARLEDAIRALTARGAH